MRRLPVPSEFEQNPQTALERCISLLCVPPTRCNSVDWLLPDSELTELFAQGSREYFQSENRLPKALYKQFNTVVRRPFIQTVRKPQVLSHRDIVIAMAMRCSKIGSNAQSLTAVDARLVAKKAPRISELLLAQYAERRTSFATLKTSSQELVFSGATS